MSLTRHATTAATATLLAFALAPATWAFVVPPADEVQYLVEMPLAVTRVVEVGVREPQVEAIMLDLNRSQVPAYQSVELLRYAPLDLFLDDPLGLGVDLGFDFGGDEPILLVLLGAHIDAGLVGLPLADAVFLDLERMGVPVVERRATRRAVRQPVVLRPRFVPFEVGTRMVREGDRLVVLDRDGRRVRDDGDRRVVRDRDRVAVPPGHAKHGPGGPHPTPGHVKHHDGPDANPGHARAESGSRAPQAKREGKPEKGQGKAKDGGPGKGSGKARGEPQGRGKADGKGKAGGKDRGKADGRGGGRGAGAR